jgi:hypothetical protein
MADRSIRNLDQLENSASTARVLNLRLVARTHGDDPDYADKPLFRSRSLNTSIIVKHRLRGNESQMFNRARRNATKVLIPIDTNDLRLGARYVFIGQRDFEASLQQAFGVEMAEDCPDHRTLRILDETPSLDPFLLREQLRRHDLEPARCYFEISQADTQRMFKFAQHEIEPLVRMSLGAGRTDPGGAHAEKLTQKILANSTDADLEPLRLTLQLDPQQYQEGVFCWKAFLYYKWQLADLLPRVSSVLAEVEAKRPHGQVTDETKTYLTSARENISRELKRSCQKVKATLAIYDAAYHGLTEGGEPRKFRDFLLQAPGLFSELGERLGGIEHIISFWRYRFASGKPTLISPDDLVDLFMDFEGSLSTEPTGSAGGASRIVSPVLAA